MVGVVLQVWRERVVDVMRQRLPELVLQPAEAPGTLKFEQPVRGGTWTVVFLADGDSFDVLVGVGEALQPLAALAGAGRGEVSGYELFPLPDGDDLLARAAFESLARGALGDLSAGGARAAVEPAIQVAVADLQAFAIPFLERTAPAG